MGIFYDDVTVMIGGYKAVLTVKQRNDFHEFMIQNPMFIESRKLSEERDILEKSTDDRRDEMLRRVISRMFVLEDELYFVSKKWCEDNLPKEK